MPYKEKKRERRRRDLQRMKKRSVSVAKIQMRMMFWDESEHCNAQRQRIITRAIKHAEHMAVCSCTNCGNPRKKMKYLTLKEIKENEKALSYDY